MFRRNMQIPNNHAGYRTHSRTEGLKTKGLECRIKYEFRYMALYRKYDLLLPSLVDHAGRTLKDGLCPESHRDGQPINNILGAVWRATERNHNHAKFGGKRIKLLKIATITFPEVSHFCRLDACRNHNGNKVCILKWCDPSR